MTIERPRTQSAAEAYLSTLHTCGIRHVFANSGTDFAPLIEGLVRMKAEGRPAPNFITVPHENVAMAMAQGYSKITGEASCVMVHVNVGTANAVMGVMNAARDNVPVLLAAGRTPLTETGDAGSRDVLIHWAQENFDQAGIVRENVKWDYELRSGQPVATLVSRALEIALAEPQGPVYLSLPREVLGEQVEDIGPLPRRPLGTLAAVPSGDAIEQAASMIADAKSPLIIAGRSGRTAAAFYALGDLAIEHALPVVQGPFSSIAHSNPMYLGFATNDILNMADLIVVLDAPVPWVPHNMRPGRETKIIHIAHDPHFSSYPMRGFECDLAVAGDPGVAIDMLRVALRDKLRERQPAVDARRTRVTEMRNTILARRAAVIEQAKSLAPIHPAFVAHALNQVKDKDAIISDELGVPLPFLELDLPGCFLAGSSGGLGVGLGQALGAKLAAPHRQVITCCGDGSYMFGLPTAAHYVGRAEKLPTLTIIMNNSMWYAVRRATLGMYPDGMASKANHLPMVDLTPAPDYEKIVEACGGYGERVEDPGKLIGAIERGLRKVEDGTAVTLNVVTRARE
ncbi:MAG: hypothetical protein JWM36_4071 [Hyphomicrobiales bacterium]|nr:hypothetical protein [Hyphomicrobiales bacterium]